MPSQSRRSGRIVGDPGDVGQEHLEKGEQGWRPPARCAAPDFPRDHDLPNGFEQVGQDAGKLCELPFPTLVLVPAQAAARGMVQRFLALGATEVAVVPYEEEIMRWQLGHLLLPNYRDRLRSSARRDRRRRPGRCFGKPTRSAES